MHNAVRSFYSSKPRLEVSMNFNIPNYGIREQEIFETVYYISFLITAINVFCDKKDLFVITNLSLAVTWFAICCCFT